MAASENPTPTVLFVKPLRSKPMKNNTNKNHDLAFSPSPPSSSSYRKMWTEEESIVILKGLAEFKATHNGGREPCNLSEYDLLRDHLLAKKNIAGDFDRVKLSDKVRKLRSKFLSLYNDKNVKNRKNRKNGGNTSEYERVLFDLGQRIWANSNKNDVDDEEVREIDSDGLKNNKNVDNLDDEIGLINSNNENIDDIDDEIRAVKPNGLNNDMDIDIYNDDDDCIKRNDGGGGGRDFCRVTMNKKKEKKKNVVVDENDSTQCVPPCAILKNVVKNLEKNDGLIIHGTLELALQTMKPERRKAWDEKWTKQCLVETQAYKKRKVLEKNLVQELHDIITKKNDDLSPT